MTIPSAPPESPRLRRFQFDLPAGFVELPVDPEDLDPESFGALRAEIAGIFGFETDASSTEAAALGMATLGLLMAGVDYAAVGFYQSPDEPGRPIMVVLTATGLPSEHDRPETAIDGLVEIHEAQGLGTVGRLTLPTGPAVVVVSEQESVLHIGDAATPVLQRQVAAWVPDRAGSTIAVLTASTNSWRDWEHVCALGLDVFESLEWFPAEEASAR